VVETNMEKAIRVISVERGYDPRDYTLVAFGGAGGLHACALAAALEIPRALIPKFPGGLSALGILRADVVEDFSRTILLPINSPQSANRVLRREFRAIDARAMADLRREGFSRSQMKIEHLLDMRYIGQAYELTVSAIGNFAAAFHQAHAKRYGYSDATRPVEIVNVRARAIGVTPKPALPKIQRGGAESGAALIGSRSVYFGVRKLPTRIYDRARLRAGNRLRGPAIVTEYSATTILLPGWMAHVDAYGNLLLEPA
jgi:N-methylhydantoinase A